MAGLPAAPCDLPPQFPETGRRLAEQLIDVLHTCPNPEIARLGRTLRQWRTQILARFATGGVNNGGTGAINGIIEKARRLAHGFWNFDNNRLRILLAADGIRPYRRPPTPCLIAKSRVTTVEGLHAVGALLFKRVRARLRLRNFAGFERTCHSSRNLILMTLKSVLCGADHQSVDQTRRTSLPVVDWPVPTTGPSQLPLDRTRSCGPGAAYAQVLCRAVRWH
jgi:hypothetical protein